MENDVIARTPVATPVEVAPQEGGKVTDTIPDHDTGKPVSDAKEFLTNSLELGEAATHFEMPKFLEQIAEYFHDELGDGSEAKYQELLDSLVERLKLNNSTSIYAKIERLASLIRIETKLKEIEKEKTILKEKPIEQMTSTQLRKAIEDGIA